MFISCNDLLPWINEILDEVTPSSNHKKMLNILSARQIADSTYVENLSPNIASDANFIVPKSLYECKQNQVWRYPPHLYTDFLIRSHENCVTGIKIKMRMAIPCFIRYKEKQGKRTQYKTNPSIKLPSNFGWVNLFGKTYQMDYDGQMKVVSVKPKLFERDVEINVNELNTANDTEKTIDIIDWTEQKIVVKKFDAHANETETGDPTNEPRDLGDDPIKKESQQDIQIGYVELVYGPSKARLIARVNKEIDCYRVSFDLINDIEYNKARPRTSEWMRRSLVLPHIFITIAGGEPRLPLQQHYDSFYHTINNGEQKLAKDYDQEYPYTQVNGVLTKSTSDKTKLCFSMFGIYDTIKIMPVAGPSVESLLKNDESLFNNLYLLNDEEKTKLQSETKYLSIIKAVLRAAVKAFNIKTNFHKFQWDAIQNRLKQIVNKDYGTTTVVKAPTATGKTLVFMVDAALHSLLLHQRSVLVFPTRILNEDMFRRLTKFIYEIKHESPHVDITGGIYIGTSDPLYKALASPSTGKVMIQHDVCPACNNRGSIKAKELNNRKVGKCSNEKCGHEISYMFGPKEVPDYLPLITIATPDNLFYNSTYAKHERYRLRFFGGYYIRCNSCNYCQPIMDETEGISCQECHRTLDQKRKVTSPIGYFVFDEVHSLYGLTGILLSIYLKTIDIVSNKIRDLDYYHRSEGELWQSTYETGTATIANEEELLQALTRVRKKIIIIADTRDYLSYFNPEPTSIKYRTIVMLPVAKSAISSVSNGLLRLYNAINLDTQFRNMITEIAKGAYDFILGYLFRKSDGYTLTRTIRDLASQELERELNVEFLSGDARNDMIVKLLQMVSSGEIKIMLANLVISLGIDISNLNNIVMMGLPKSMTEFVQTAGRTGRGEFPGHTVIHLLPSNPRDMYVFENFHRIFNDVGGYLEMKPIKSTNAYAAKIIFPNILKFILAAQSYHRYVLTIAFLNKFLQIRDNKIAIRNDILYALADHHPNDPTKLNSLQETIVREVVHELDEFTNKCIKVSGPRNYLSDWFDEEGRILKTLRERENKEISVIVDDVELFNKIGEQQQFKPPWTYDPEEETIDNDSDEDE
jgi:superfamily II DNA or RNA helicase